MARTRPDAPGSPTMARAGLWILFAAHVVASWGTQWDIQWHLTIGRDSFWIAPHLMTYSGVAAIVLVSFGMLAWTTARALPGAERGPGTMRVLGLTGTPGYHAAAWGIALTVLAAPIDDLWHRLFGLDVTLWSPPHLLGLLGAIVNAAACWLIARETYAAGSRPRLAAMVVAGALVYGGIGVGIQPSVRIAYVHGGIRFFTYPILAALLVPLALVVTARVSRSRPAPVLAVLLALLIGVTGAAIARAGFAWLQPVSVIGEEIARDPTSPIAISHEIARKNGRPVGAYGARVVFLALLGALAMVAVDARRRPGLAAFGYGATMLVTVSVALARMPAFAQSLPSTFDAALATVLTALAALAGGAAARLATGGDGADRSAVLSPRRGRIASL
ncbi:MAG: hypothetical protein HYU51_08570 [Candidatus Rokubacteria bacterium]|nr:hypothetical protein [Candidatus Rokubacteria bacterium]